MIIGFAALAAIGTYLFTIHIMTAKDTYVDPRVFLNRDFFIGMVMVFMLGFMIYGMAGLLPKVVQHHMGHTPMSAGIVMSMRGIGAIVGATIAGWLLQGKDPRPTVLLGLFSHGRIHVAVVMAYTRNASNLCKLHRHFAGLLGLALSQYRLLLALSIAWMRTFGLMEP